MVSANCDVRHFGSGTHSDSYHVTGSEPDQESAGFCTLQALLGPSGVLRAGAGLTALLAPWRVQSKSPETIFRKRAMSVAVSVHAWLTCSYSKNDSQHKPNVVPKGRLAR